ncbi:M48 family metallopeptidase [Oleiharenicola lentus]|uniref:M48 family metallopeptidase n=1 Tax=Oleiharenicola lentus TaxID=2508720 RepID=UPI003F661544
MKRLLLPLAALALSIFTGCTTVPETGRRQVIITNEATETQMGLEAFAAVKKETPVLNDAKVQARIERIGRRVADAVGRSLPNAQWEFVVFNDDKTVNAFALPGGKVGVYTGLIKLASSDDEIAIVMGHEVAHVTSRHGGERASQTTLAQGGAALVGALSENSEYKNAFNTAYGLAAQGLVLLPFSRLHESEADNVGLRFAAGAGYDPRAAAAFWKKMQAKSEGKEQWKWISTHPPTAERIANLEQLATGLMPIYEEAKKKYQ